MVRLTGVLVLQQSVSLGYVHLEGGGVLTLGAAKMTIDLLIQVSLDMVPHVIFPPLDFLANVAFKNMGPKVVKYFCHQRIIVEFFIML